ncbi:hypothetical protein ISS37_05365 [candidate division KSB1 bacterium]|nr:hypothetical protein [candidate division KSB1 bacterium]
MSLLKVIVYIAGVTAFLVVSLWIFPYYIEKTKHKKERRSSRRRRKVIHKRIDKRTSEK